MHHRRLTPAILVIGLLCGRAAAQTTCTMDQVKEIALTHNVNILQSRNSVRSSQGAVLSAYGTYLPSLSASASWNRSENNRTSGTQLIGNQLVPLPASSTTSNSFSTNIGLSYLLFDGFGREAALTQAKANSAAAGYAWARMKQTVLFQCESGYLNVLRSAELVKVNEENLKRDRDQQAQIDESRRIGTRSDADVYRQQALVSSDEVALISARNTFDNAKADLVSLMGVDGPDQYEFADAAFQTDLRPSQLDSIMARYSDVAGLMRRAKEVNPDYLAAKESAAAADASTTVAKSGYWPSVNANAGYRLSSPELSTLDQNNTINWGIGLSWTLFDGFRTNQAVQAADAAKSDAELNLEQNERNMNVAIRKAVLQLDAARSQYDASAKGLVSATEDRRVTQERYNLGAATIIDLQTANASYMNAIVNTINAAYNFHVAVRTILYAMGETDAVPQR